MMREMIKIENIDGAKLSYIFKNDVRIKALLIIYEDNSTGIDVKSKLSLADIVFLVRNICKILRGIDYIITAYCKQTNIKGNKLAKLLGFTPIDCNMRYNRYRYDPSITSKHSNTNSD
jgi:hypothetical protein